MCLLYKAAILYVGMVLWRWESYSLQRWQQCWQVSSAWRNFTSSTFSAKYQHLVGCYIVSLGLWLLTFQRIAVTSLARSNSTWLYFLLDSSTPKTKALHFLKTSGIITSMIQCNNTEYELLSTAIPLTNERTQILNQFSSWVSYTATGVQHSPKQLHLQWISTKFNWCTNITELFTAHPHLTRIHQSANSFCHTKYEGCSTTMVPLHNQTFYYLVAGSTCSRGDMQRIICLDHGHPSGNAEVTTRQCKRLHMNGWEIQEAQFLIQHNLAIWPCTKPDKSNPHLPYHPTSLRSILYYIPIYV
jgi:hypothetical protein